MAAGRVGVLDGGLPAWKAQGLDLDDREVPEAEAQKAAEAASQEPSNASTYQASLQVLAFEYGSVGQHDACRDTYLAFLST